MKVVNASDFPVTNEACKESTGKTLNEWFDELDRIDGLRIGRRASCQHMTSGRAMDWWPTTIYVEYEKHKNILKKDGLPEGFSICCTKNISAKPEHVYETWVNPNLFKDMFGDNAKFNLEVGGLLECEEGCRGTFLRIRPGKDLRFTWEHPGCTGPMLVDVSFNPNGDKCVLYVNTARIQTRAESDGLRDAWAKALSRLKDQAEA